MLRCPVLITFIVLTSCSSGRDPGRADEYIQDCSLVASGQPFASDENYVKFVEAESANRVVLDQCRSPELVAPDLATRLDATTPPVFSFNAVRAVCATRKQPFPVYGCCPVRSPRPFWSKLVSVGTALFEGTAEAHCGAFSGENYFFRFKRRGDNNPIYSAVLSVTSFTPNAAIWQRALAGRNGQTLLLTIQRGVFFRGNLNEGPYLQPQPYSFTVGP